MTKKTPQKTQPTQSKTVTPISICKHPNKLQPTSLTKIADIANLQQMLQNLEPCPAAIPGKKWTLTNKTTASPPKSEKSFEELAIEKLNKRFW